jgi:hypothetical protein
MNKTGDNPIWWHNGGTGAYSTLVAFCRHPAVAVHANTGEPNDVVDKLGGELIGQLVEAGK